MWAAQHPFQGGGFTPRYGMLIGAYFYSYTLVSQQKRDIGEANMSLKSYL